MLISKSYAETMKGSYLNDLENAKKGIRKNFEEMDLENVKLRDSIEEVITSAEKQIDKAISDIEKVSFE